ncbi:EexN family lipoprotein [Marinomonas sp. 5E14-1]|uniref:EexN family lipoprotein n=1 Tax=Marinomonas sp. 5E14-1 TaxID=3153922 RepID=UPI003262CF11
MYKLIATSTLAVFLIACSPKEEVKTVQFYLDNEDALELKMAYCKNNPGKAMTDENCINSLEASSKLKDKVMFGEGFKVDYSSLDKEKG